MALSGSFYTYPVGSFGLYCTWSASQNIPGYYSDVTVNVYLQHYSIYVGARTNSTIKCGTDTYTYTAPALSYESGTALTKTLMASHTFRVYHDAGGGNKSIVLSTSWAFNGTYSGAYVGTISASATISLDAIPQQSAIQSVVVDANNKVTVNLTRYVGTFTHSVKFVFGTYSYTATGVGTSTSYTIPLDWLNAIPNSVTGVGAVQVTTYSGSSTVGNVVSHEFVVTAPDSVKPKIGGISWTKTSTEPSNWPLTKNVSTGVMSMTGVSGMYGSTVSAYSLTFAGLSSNSAELTVGNITSYGTLKAVAKVTDSRGRTAIKEVDFQVASYSKPTLTAQSYRSNADGVEDDVGEYMSITADVALASVADNALASFVFGYKQHSSSAYTEVEIDPGYPLVIEASSNYTWDWYVTAADAVSSVTLQGSIPTGDVIMDIKADGSGITFGGVAEEAGLHSKWDYTGKKIVASSVEAPFVEAAIINTTDMSAECVYAGQLLVGNQDVVDHVVEQGTSGIWYYKKWYSGLLEMWGTYDFNMNKADADSYAITNTIAYPFSLKSVVNLQVSNSGGYLVSFKINSATTHDCSFLYWVRGDASISGVPQTLYINVIGTWK